MEEENKVEEQLKDNKSKKSMGILVIIVVLLLVCGGLSCFIILNKDKLMAKSKQEKVPEVKVKEVNDYPKKVVIYSVLDEKVSHLIDTLLMSDPFNCSKIENYTNDKKIEANDISNEKATIMALITNHSEEKKEITVEEVTKMIQKYLGKDYKYDPSKLPNLKGECISHYYDSQNKKFIPQETGCGGICGPTTSSYKLVKAVDTDGVLTLDVKVVFADEEKGIYYSDYKKTNEIGNFNTSSDYLYPKGSDYQFVFKNEDGNYVFTSVEAISK